MSINEADPHATPADPSERVQSHPIPAAQPRRFGIRGFASLLFAAAGLAMAISGVMLFFAPRGCAANATDWRLLGLDREAWASVHVNLIILFALTAPVHVVLNWSALVACIKGMTGRGPDTLKKMTLAMLV